MFEQTDIQPTRTVAKLIDFQQFIIEMQCISRGIAVVFSRGIYHF